jgi:hypothetical protein
VQVRPGLSAKSGLSMYSGEDTTRAPPNPHPTAMSKAGGPTGKGQQQPNERPPLYQAASSVSTKTPVEKPKLNSRERFKGAPSSGGLPTYPHGQNGSQPASANASIAGSALAGTVRKVKLSTLDNSFGIIDQHKRAHKGMRRDVVVFYIVAFCYPDVLVSAC